MNYSFENLGFDRFQELCQAIVVKQYKEVQCLPTNQPDGGRDILSFFESRPKSGNFTVFQVKQVTKASIDDPIKEFKKLIDKEKGKIEKLASMGMEKYILVTNIKGSAHLNSGKIDRANKLLEESIPVPSECWWYDDIARRVDGDISLKWSYPEMLDGHDMLNTVLYSMINDNIELRKAAVNAYLADQYEIDNEVKFKQIDLQNRLVELYTDVSISLKSHNKKDRHFRRALFEHDLDEFSIQSFHHSEVELASRGSNVGAAEFLLSKVVQENIARILLEGGPGQGKSTVSQYICQVNRVKLLGKKEDLKHLPESIKACPVRLPFKIDLRHVADWVKRSDPYGYATSDTLFKQRWKKSLESFLVWHMIYHSQLDDFDVSDLHGILRHSPVLLVFDGFDEIADLEARGEVIHFINEGVNRLIPNSLSLQVLVTSRPSVFSEKYSFSDDLYPHFELCELGKDKTKEYVSKWAKANRLDRHELRSIEKLVNEKLEMDHLRELAKSPMQLAIFISLLRTKGESLPNKRTALFDSYIDLFFDRESEKSQIVRDNRDLIIELHQYLGWVLHSEAELYNNSGIIAVDDLKVKLNQFLEVEGHQTDIADKLFDAVRDRVCALASRVQGTFEFEVQPLREYFCSKYLYETSPYSPAGNEKRNTLPERFSAISRNFYWQNVVRFFSGCLNKGELPMLVSELKDLNDDPLLQYTNYPKILTAQLLSDYVFKQYPRLLREVVNILVEGIATGNLVVERQYISGRDLLLTVPKDCGRAEIVNQCFSQLKKFPKRDHAENLIGIARNNSYLILENWLDFAKELQEDELTIWLGYGYSLGVIHSIPEYFIENLLSTESEKHLTDRVRLLVNGNCLHPIIKSEEYKKIALNLVLDYKSMLLPRQSITSVQLLSCLLHPFVIGQVMKGDSRFGSINELLKGFFFGTVKKNKDVWKFTPEDSVDNQILSFFDKIDDYFGARTSDLRSSLNKWDILVESGRQCFGETFIFPIIATLASAIRSKEEKFKECHDFFDESLSMCKRFRYARLQSNNLGYWSKTLKARRSSSSLLVFFTWANSRLLTHLLPEVENAISAMTESAYESLVAGVSATSRISNISMNDFYTNIRRDPSLDISDRVAILISFRLSKKNREDLLLFGISRDSELSEKIMRYRLACIEGTISDKNNRELNLKVIRETYKNIKTSDGGNIFYDFDYYDFPHLNLELDLSMQIMKNCKEYPASIVFLAERTCNKHAGENTIPVGKVASSNLWFES